MGVLVEGNRRGDRDNWMPPADDMAITAEPIDDEEELPLAVLTADTLAAID